MALILEALANLAVLIFILTSMFGMGLSLTLKQIGQALRNVRLVVLALVVNFAVVPLVAVLLLLAIPLAQPLAIGLFLLATAAGAPFLPKLAQFAKGNLAASVGLMVLLMVVTILYLPIVLPLLLPLVVPGVTVAVNPIDIATSLIVVMLLPLGIGLLVKARYEGTAETLRPTMNHASSFSMILLMVLILALNFSAVVGTIGTGALLAAIVFIGASFGIGYLVGGPAADTKRVVGLATGQRNLSAALLVAAQNFQDPNVVVMVVVAGLVGLFLLVPIAAQLGKRAAAPPAPQPG